MQRPSPLLAALVLVGVAAAAHAQPSASEEVPALATVLEQRVPEELAAEGVVLSRRNLRLEIEQIGGKLLISVVDITLGRTVASTKLDEIPGDREAAVATVTHLVAELVRQTLGHTPDAPPAIAIIDDRAERERRDIAELQYRQQALRFGAGYVGENSVTSAALIGAPDSRRWSVYRGDLDHELTREDFYRVIERPDLLKDLRTRRDNTKMLRGMAWLSGMVSAVGTVFLVRGAVENGDVNTGWGIASLGGLVASATFAMVASHRAASPHPIPLSEAKSLADAYNRRLRGQLGLPTASSRPPIRELRLSAGPGGLALGGTF